MATEAVPRSRERRTAARRSREPVTVVCAADDAFAACTAAMLHSAAAHLPAGARLRAFVIDDGLGEAARARLRRAAERFPAETEIEWLDPDLAPLAGFGALSEWPRAVYLRLLAGELLPPGVRRTIYLDTDIIVRADLTELWEAALDGCTVGAVQNHLPSQLGEEGGVPECGGLGIDPRAPYFNSGLLVIDLARWRAERVGERALAYIPAHPADLRYPDQEALNAVLAGRWKPLPLEWNVLTSIYFLESWPDSPLRRAAEARERTLVDGAKAIHYCGKPKPWMPRCPHPLKEMFSRHLRASGWEEMA